MFKNYFNPAFRNHVSNNVLLVTGFYRISFNIKNWLMRITELRLNTITEPRSIRLKGLR